MCIILDNFVELLVEKRILKIRLDFKHTVHSALMLNLIKLFRKRKQLSQHQCLTPIESGITSSQILQIQNSLD